MSTPDTPPSSAELATLAAVIRQVVRTQRLSAVDAQDFAQTVHLRLLERQYDIFARFDGRSSLRSYLNVVVTRLLLDWRNAMYGKWRPSAVARRLGQDAARLDCLINRDGYSCDEAVEIVETLTRAPRGRLRALADRLPRRQRPRFVEYAFVRARVAAEFLDPVEAEEASAAARRSKAALAHACRLLNAEERQMVAMRYARSLSLQQIGRTLDIHPKQVYRRFDRTIKKLRDALGQLGVTSLNLSH